MLCRQKQASTAMSSPRGQQEQATESMSFPRWAEGGMESMLSEAVPIGYNFFVPPPIDSLLRTYPRRNDMGGWFDASFRFKQASTAMSSSLRQEQASESMSFPRWAEGGMESMLSEAVTIRLQLLCPASHRFHASAHTSAGMTWEAGWKTILGKVINTC